jgi:starch phosphorylase
MATDYLRDYYAPAARHGRRLARDKAAGAKALAVWRRKILDNWPALRIRLASPPPTAVNVGEAVPIHVAVYLNGLDPEDVEVECLLGKQNDLGALIPAQTLSFSVAGTTDEGETLYHVDLCEPRPSYSVEGLEMYQIRMYPRHPMLAHRFETGCMLWL